MLILLLKNNNCSTGSEKVFNTFNFTMLKTFSADCKLQTVIYIYVTYHIQKVYIFFYKNP